MRSWRGWMCAMVVGMVGCGAPPEEVEEDLEVPSAGTVEAALVSPTFVNCDEVTRRDVSLALLEAQALAAESESYLRNHSLPLTSLRYTTHFGVANTTSWNLLAQNFGRIRDAFSAPLRVTCVAQSPVPSQPIYANRLQPGDVFVVPAGHPQLPTRGDNSRRARYLEVMSNFEAVIGTDEHADGRISALLLAVTNPSLALDNGDSYALFAENSLQTP